MGLVGHLAHRYRGAVIFLCLFPVREAKFHLANVQQMLPKLPNLGQPGPWAHNLHNLTILGAEALVGALAAALASAWLRSKRNAPAARASSAAS